MIRGPYRENTVCRLCGVEKPREDFYAGVSGRGHPFRRRVCKPCYVRQVVARQRVVGRDRSHHAMRPGRATCACGSYACPACGRHQDAPGKCYACLGWTTSRERWAKEMGSVLFHAGYPMERAA